MDFINPDLLTLIICGAALVVAIKMM